MIYLLYGTEKYLIDLEINKIIKQHKIDEINIIKYDLDIDFFKEVIDDCQTISLFSNKKLIIVDNPFTELSKEDENLLEKYINSPNLDTILILRCSKLDERKKIIKLLMKKVTVKEFNNTNLIEKVKNMFDDFDIKNDTINLLIERVGSDLNLLHNEIEKIKIYKDNDKNITKEDIISLTHKNIDLDVFKLIDNIVNHDKEKSLELYNELLKNGSEPIAIIVMLANQFRIMYQAKELIKKGYTEKDIASTINIHPYRVKLALQNSRSYNSKVLLKYLSDLAQLDIDIKSGNIDKNLGLELFILNT